MKYRHCIIAVNEYLLHFSDQESDQKEVLKAFRGAYTQGRALNLHSRVLPEEGETFSIVKSRYDVYSGMMDELGEKRFNGRIPLCVHFMGEVALVKMSVGRERNF